MAHARTCSRGMPPPQVLADALAATSAAPRAKSIIDSNFSASRRSRHRRGSGTACGRRHRCPWPGCGPSERADPDLLPRGGDRERRDPLKPVGSVTRRPSSSRYSKPLPRRRRRMPGPEQSTFLRRAMEEPNARCAADAISVESRWHGGRCSARCRSTLIWRFDRPRSRGRRSWGAYDGLVPLAALRDGFEFRGNRISFGSFYKGIHRPKEMQGPGALTLMTAAEKPGKVAPVRR